MGKKKKYYNKKSPKSNIENKINTVDEDFVAVGIVKNKEVSEEELKELETFIKEDEVVEEEIIYQEGELDSSFIEGKVSNKKIDTTKDTVVVFNDDVSFKYKIKLLLMFSIILILSGISFYLYTNPIIEKVEVEKIVVEENIVFLGDSITQSYDLEKYYSDKHVVNSGISGHKTYDILDDMYNRVYKYNPSKVFLNIGINDLSLEDYDVNEISDNIIKIFEEIKINRDNTELYFVSIYPINDSEDAQIDLDMVGIRDNEDVIKVNEIVKEYCDKNNIKYIDLYNKLLNEDSMIDLEYTTEGLHITDKGYEVITEEINKFLD